MHILRIRDPSFLDIIDCIITGTVFGPRTNVEVPIVGVDKRLYVLKISTSI